jgi:hypothetical protein
MISTGQQLRGVVAGLTGRTFRTTADAMSALVAADAGERE